MSREIDPYRIPKARWEVAPAAGLAAIDLNGNGGAWSGREFIGESTLGGVAVYAIYQALLTALRTEALRKRGAIDRPTQVQAIAASVWESANMVRLSAWCSALCCWSSPGSAFPWPWLDSLAWARPRWICSMPSGMAWMMGNVRSCTAPPLMQA